ncbi:putative ubiquitin carboxyl-terminal hydrolase 3 [Russula decolorans]
MSSTRPTPAHMPMPAPARMPASALPVPNTSSASWDAYPASTSNFMFRTDRTPYVIDFPAPDARPSSRVSPLQGANLINLLSGTAPSHLTDNDTTRRLRALGIVNSGNKCFVNAVLQLLVHCPPFWDLFEGRARLVGQQGLGEGHWQETGGGATPLVDATIKVLDEFVHKETPSAMQQPQQKAEKGKSMEDKEEKEEHDTVDSLELTYIYDVMKEKRQLNSLLDGQQQDAAEFLNLYLEALDEELVLVMPRAYTSTHKSASAPGAEEREDETRSADDQIEVRRREYTAKSVESPISRIFGGRSRFTVRVPSIPDTVNFESWRSLKLNILPDSVHTIQDAFAHISQLQPMQADQSSSSGASKQMQIEALPPVLVLHLERFPYDTATNGIVKISKPVQFAPELEIPLEIMAPVSEKSAKPAHYKLFGVLYHRGQSTKDGHYTVDVLRRNGDGSVGKDWLHIDDETVSAVRHKDVFGSHVNEQVDHQCAYMLFYCRTPPPRA